MTINDYDRWVYETLLDGANRWVYETLLDGAMWAKACSKLADIVDSRPSIPECWMLTLAWCALTSEVGRRCYALGRFDGGTREEFDGHAVAGQLQCIAEDLEQQP